MFRRLLVYPGRDAYDRAMYPSRDPKPCKNIFAFALPVPTMPATLPNLPCACPYHNAFGQPLPGCAMLAYRNTLYRNTTMRLDAVLRDESSKPYMTLVNRATRRHVANLSPFDNAFTSQRIVEATDLYADLLETGLLKPVLEAIEKRKKASAELPK